MKCSFDPVKCDWHWCHTRRLCLINVQSVTGKTQFEIMTDQKHWPAKYNSQGAKVRVDKRILKQKAILYVETVISLRKRIFIRDGYKCVICDSTEKLTIDHIMPKSKGGSNKEDNLQTMCSRCNGVKGDKRITNATLKELIEKYY